MDLKRIRQAARLAGFVGITSGMLAGLVTAESLAREEDRERIRDEWTRRWSRALMELFSISRKVEGVSFPSRRGRLVVANHRSTIDIGLVLETFGRSHGEPR